MSPCRDCAFRALRYVACWNVFERRTEDENEQRASATRAEPLASTRTDALDAGVHAAGCPYRGIRRSTTLIRNGRYARSSAKLEDLDVGNRLAACRFSENVLWGHPASLRGCTSPQLGSRPADLGTCHGEYYVTVEYKYEFARSKLTGGRYAFLPPTSFLPEQTLLALQDHFPAACYVNPSYPSESVVERVLPWQAYSWTGLVFLSCGAFVLLWLRRFAKAG